MCVELQLLLSLQFISLHFVVFHLNTYFYPFCSFFFFLHIRKKLTYFFRNQKGISMSSLLSLHLLPRGERPADTLFLNNIHLFFTIYFQPYPILGVTDVAGILKTAALCLL